MKLTHIQYNLLFFLGIFLFSCNSSEKKIEIDTSKHEGLIELQSNLPFKTLYSDGQLAYAKKQTDLVDEAYTFLSEIMGPKNDFCLLVVGRGDWKKSAYSSIVGMPEYYKGNLIVGAGESDIAKSYEEMIKSFPEPMISDLIKTYTNQSGKIDMSLFFNKLSIHELTHNFQDPKNQEGYSMSRWLEEIHANMGLYAFYKSNRRNELKYILSLVDFSLKNPPPDLEYTSLVDFDSQYYKMSPPNYGHYQMKFTKAAQKLIDSLGNKILKPLNDFIIKYDESWKDKLTNDDFKIKLATEVDPYFLETINNWEKQSLEQSSQKK